MKFFFIIASFFFLCFFYSCLLQKQGKQALYDLKNSVTNIPPDDSLSIMTAHPNEEGNAEAGYKYLLEGNAFNAGIPIEIYNLLKGIKSSKLAQLAGYSRFAINDFVVFKNDNGRLTATPGCLYCHAQQFNNEFVIGLGNSYSNFQANTTRYIKILETAIRIRYGKNSDEWKTADKVFRTARILAPNTLTQMQGPTPAQKIAEIMASHRDPVTLKFSADTNYFSVPPIIIPEDVPALWISKKRKALGINAIRQGGFLKHIVSISLLTMKDTAEAREIYNHTKDVWAYIKKIQPPEYPYTIDQSLARKGKQIFLKACAYCHGTYDEDGYYPNKLIPGHIIGTDSLMWKYYIKYPEYAEWFNKSWFSASEPKSFIKPQTGYVPPPLDGVWITGPYFHNGSVPTIENVLNSKTRPQYWKRNFNKQEYDYQKLGLKYKTHQKSGNKKIYNTDIPGYGNYGHYFGDKLTDGERKAVIEYLKTL